MCREGRRGDRRAAGSRERRAEAGLSLIELVVAIVVVSIALGGTLLVVDTAARRSSDPMLEWQALSIAEAYLEEALQKSYRDPDGGGPCGPSEPSRSLYDDVCDYDGLDELGARDQSGRLVNGLESYRIRIEVDTAASLGGLSGASEVMRVDVTVRDPLGRPVRLAGYRTSP
ncbi:MAG: prepilin-type N-terminal cleavage/methylation domain-containing protein [bacterium]